MSDEKLSFESLVKAIKKMPVSSESKVIILPKSVNKEEAQKEWDKNYRRIFGAAKMEHYAEVGER